MTTETIYQADKWASIATASEEYGISRRQIERLIQAGTVRVFKTLDRTFVYRPDVEQRPRRGATRRNRQC